VSKAKRTEETPQEAVPNSARRPVRRKSARANLQPLAQKREVAPAELLTVEAQRLAAMATLTRNDLATGRGLTYEWEFFIDQLFRDLSGAGIGPQTVVFEQATAAAVWTIFHGLNGFPSVVLVDNSGQEMHAEVHYPDDQRVVINHGQPYAGIAYLRV
jgi:hypothetical protein